MVRFVLAAAFGILGGLGLFTAALSEAPSYLFDAPETCVNCHVMRLEYSTWQHSSHQAVAVCNDCHVPHDSIARKYLFKAMDGTRHAAIFSFGTVPEVIRIRAESRDTVQENCVRCHDQKIADTHTDGGKSCFDCHVETRHR